MHTILTSARTDKWLLGDFPVLAGVHPGTGFFNLSTHGRSAYAAMHVAQAPHVIGITKVSSRTAKGLFIAHASGDLHRQDFGQQRSSQLITRKHDAEHVFDLRKDLYWLNASTCRLKEAKKLIS